MDPPTHSLMKDSDFSFFNSLDSILTTPYFTCPHVAANDGEFGFDPHPAMASLPEYVSLSKMYDGGNTRSQIELQGKGQFQEQVKLTKANEMSPCKQGEGFSNLEACEGARSSKDVSSHVVRHGLITPPPFTSPVSKKVPKVVKRRAQNSASPRKSYQPRIDVSAASASASFVSSSSEANAKAISKASDRTRKTKTRIGASAGLPDDRKRKLSLEMNRIAAANCRIKKQEKERCLQAQSRELVSKNKVLKQSVSEMTQQLQELRSMLKVHVLSSGCYAPSYIQEALGEQSSHDSFSSMSPCDDNGSNSMDSLHRDRVTSDTSIVPEMVADDWSLSDRLTLEGLSPPWDSLLSSLDFEEGFEITAPASANAMCCDPVGR